MSSPVADTRTCWASEKNASMNATTIAPRTMPEAVRPATGPDRATDAPALERRALGDARPRAAARWCVGGRPRRRPSISRRARSGCAGCADRGTRADRPGRPGPTRRARTRSPRVCWPRSCRSRTSCWRRPYVLRRLDLVALAHAGTPPSDAGARRRDARRPAVGRSELGGWRRSRPSVGVSDGLVTSRRRGFRPQTQTGSSGGQTQPRRSAWKNRLTMRSSSEW